MRNFGMVVKMMIMALAMGALFCSCNAAGGSDYYDDNSSKVSGTNLYGNGETQAVSISIKIPTVNVSISGEEKAFQHPTETVAITAEATEGAILSWYVNGQLQEGETGTTYQLSLQVPGLYDVTCIAVSADGKIADYDSLLVTVNP